MLRKVLFVLVVAGALGFFVGSVIDNEMFYTLSGCIAVWSGLIMTIQKNRAEKKGA
jgi:hypothetical protein